MVGPADTPFGANVPDKLVGESSIVEGAFEGGAFGSLRGLREERGLNSIWVGAFVGSGSDMLGLMEETVLSDGI